MPRTMLVAKFGSSVIICSAVLFRAGFIYPSIDSILQFCINTGFKSIYVLFLLLLLQYASLSVTTILLQLLKEMYV